MLRYNALTTRMGHAPCSTFPRSQDHTMFLSNSTRNIFQVMHWSCIRTIWSICCTTRNVGVEFLIAIKIFRQSLHRSNPRPGRPQQGQMSRSRSAAEYCKIEQASRIHRRRYESRGSPVASQRHKPGNESRHSSSNIAANDARHI